MPGTQVGKSPAGSRLDLIKATLSSKDSSQHPICGSRGRSGAKFFTFAATIMVLSDQPTLYATFGPPDDAPYEQFSFTTDSRQSRKSVYVLPAVEHLRMSLCVLQRVSGVTGSSGRGSDAKPGTMSSRQAAAVRVEVTGCTTRVVGHAGGRHPEA